MNSDNPFPDEQTVVITYLNHRGEISERRIIPYTFGLGSTDYYPSPQYLLEAYDLDKKAMRTFSLNNILNWRGNHATDTQEGIKLSGTLAAAVRRLLPEGYAISRINPSTRRAAQKGD